MMAKGGKMPKKAVQHILIPKHKKLSEKEKKDVLERYHVTFNELPSIHESDPALRDVDVEAGDVVKIERTSPTAGKTVFYRGVIDG
jgi:DNA-directed RNA polymerase subunit H